jgi:hypothetical protein
MSQPSSVIGWPLTPSIFAPADASRNKHP